MTDPEEANRMMAIVNERDRLRRGLSIIVESGAIYGAGWCVAQARGHLENLDFDQYPEDGKNS